MSEGTSRVDMTGGANVLRCFADFVASRPGLPDVVAVQVVWCLVSKVWEIRVQLHRRSVANVERWALAVDNPVITAEVGEGSYLGGYVRHQVDGTVHGHAVNVWTLIPRGGER